jgi:hypothetical protein
VDGLGGLERAFAMARSRAGLEPDAPLSIEVYPRVERTLLQRMLGDLLDEGDEPAMIASLRSSPALRALGEAATWPAGAAMALLPWVIDIR